MARIRSVHPGLFTDEAFVTCSPLARLLFIGLWTEADDGGVFEWKPVTLKMRLMPVDNIDVGSLLAELAAANMVRRFSHGGREFGAVRNFCRFQKPKKPKSIHFVPDEFRTYVGSSGPSSPPDPLQDDPGGELDVIEEPPVPKKSEIAPQMEDGEEDGGGSRRRERNPAAAAARVNGMSPLELECRGLVGQEPVLLAQDFHVVAALLDDGLTADDVRTGIAEALRIADPSYRFRAWRDFVKWIRTAGKNRMAAGPRQAMQAAPPDDPDDPNIDFGFGIVGKLSTVRMFARKGQWFDDWGPRIGEPGCRIPKHLIEEIAA